MDHLRDILFSFRIDVVRLTRSEKDYIRIHSDGAMFYCPTLPITVSCDFDVTFFPFDSHNCNIHIESQRYNESYQKLISSGFIDTLGLWRGNDQWDISPIAMVSESQQYQNGAVNFSAINIVISVQRKATYYIVAMLIPFSSVSLMEIATFFLPVGSSERLNLSFTCLLAFSFFSAIINNDLPHSSEHVPILLIVVNCYMATIGIVIILQSLSIYFHNQSSQQWSNKDKVWKVLLGSSPTVAAYRMNQFTIVFFISTYVAGFVVTFIYVPVAGRNAINQF